MLSKKDNELLTRVGPGTPMGELMRRFWMPALLEEELAEPDGTPVRLRLLGEDLVAFKDTEGRIGILDAYCPHRLAHLYFGRNENCGIACTYHGWKFDVDGNCVEMPSEPAETNFKRKVKLTSYPTQLRGGVIWIYMGPKKFASQPPEFEWSRLPFENRIAVKRLQECNWAQALEGGLDSSHVSFLHRSLADLKVAPGETHHTKYGRTGNPVFTVEEKNYGMQVAARRIGEDGRYYWRISQYLAPIFQMVPPILQQTGDSSALQYEGHAWVPIDDENVWTWTFVCNPHRPMTVPERHMYAKGNLFRGPVDENYRPTANRYNDYGLDREIQRATLYSGIPGLANQDAALQESMGPIVDRSRERLGTSDTAIINFRKIVLKLAKELKKGNAPKAAKHGEWYNVRSASVVLDADVPYEDGIKPLAQAGGIKAAAE